MNSSATVVIKLSGKLNPVEVNHAGSHVPEARCRPPNAKTRVQAATRTNQNTMLTGFPIASETQFANFRNEPGGFSSADDWVGSRIGSGAVMAVSDADKVPPISIDATAHFHLVPHSDSI